MHFDIYFRGGFLICRSLRCVIYRYILCCSLLGYNILALCSEAICFMLCLALNFVMYFAVGLYVLGMTVIYWQCHITILHWSISVLHRYTELCYLIFIYRALRGVVVWFFFSLYFLSEIKSEYVSCVLWDFLLLTYSSCIYTICFFYFLALIFFSFFFSLFFLYCYLICYLFIFLFFVFFSLSFFFIFSFFFFYHLFCFVFCALCSMS